MQIGQYWKNHYSLIINIILLSHYFLHLTQKDVKEYLKYTVISFNFVGNLKACTFWKNGTFFLGGGVEEEEMTLEIECIQAIVITLIFINIFIGE